MHEYRLLDSMIKPSSTPRTSSSSSSSASMRLDDWVLCRVWQKDNSQQRSNLWEGPHYHSMNTNFIEEPFVNNKIIAASTTITANLNYQPAGFDSIFANYLSNDCPVLTSILTNSNSNLHFHSDNPEDMLSDAGSSTSVLFNYPVNKRKSSTMVMNYDYERLLYSLNMKKVNNNISSAIEDHSETADENNQLSPSSNGINRKRGGNANSRNTNSCTYYLEPQYYNIFSNANASS
ncbi:hypothetical protein Sjap_013905 [Stephania japonica]|uniref:NAC domain-containing protein n=1 Tax=Stephania japonica TaxID=461633 RepID=A0AAP0IYX4_9MAGN